MQFFYYERLIFLKKEGIILFLAYLAKFIKFMKINNIDGEVVKDNETYLLKDNTSLKNLVVSSTTLASREVNSRTFSPRKRGGLYDYEWNRKNAA